MRETFVVLAFAAAAMAVASGPAVAHHSFAAEFDINKPVKVAGKVTKLEWTNPHAYLYLDVEDRQAGSVVNWAIEMGSPNGLTRLGWTRNLVKPGDLVTVEGSLGRTRPNFANARSVVMTTTGQKLGAGSSESTP